MSLFLLDGTDASSEVEGSSGCLGRKGSVPFAGLLDLGKFMPYFSCSACAYSNESCSEAISSSVLRDMCEVVGGYGFPNDIKDSHEVVS